MPDRRQASLATHLHKPDKSVVPFYLFIYLYFLALLPGDQGSQHVSAHLRDTK
jgi:hypothetical protein